jgi:gamma-glutamyltranspeptidase/glutathione hydrolase
MRVGASAVAVPGNLKAWCETLESFGTMPPEARSWSRRSGTPARASVVTPYLCTSPASRSTASDLALDPHIAGHVPAGRQAARRRRPAGPARLCRTLTEIAENGPDRALWRRRSAASVTDYLRAAGSYVSLADLESTIAPCGASRCG